MREREGEESVPCMRAALMFITNTPSGGYWLSRRFNDPTTSSLTSLIPACVGLLCPSGDAPPF